MLKDITLGQYFPGNTVVHRLDPRTKLLMTFLYIVLLFIAKSYFSYGVMALFLIFSVAVSKIKPGIIIRGMKPILLLVVLTALLNLFYTPGNTLAEFWVLKITDAGIYNAFFMILRIMMLIAGTFLLTYTTSPIDLTDGLEKLMGPLKKIRVPVHELSMMMSIALRFIPTLIEETDKIMSAQKARGADFETGNIIAAFGASFCERLSPRRRARGCDGDPLLPRRRGQDKDEDTLHENARLYNSGAGRNNERGNRSSGGVRAVTGGHFVA